MIPALEEEFDITSGRAIKITNLVRWMVSHPEFEDLRDRDVLDEEFYDVFTNNLLQSLRDAEGDTIEERWNNLMRDFGIYDAAGEDVLLTSDNGDVDGGWIGGSQGQKFVSKDGDTLTYRQIGYSAWKEAKTVERTPDGLLIDGVLYQPIEEYDWAAHRQQNTLSDFGSNNGQAQSLLEIAQTEPLALDLDAVLEILETPAATPAAHATAVQALVIAGNQGLEIDARFVEPLVTLLDRPSLDADLWLLKGIREIAQDDPAAIVDVRERIFEEIQLDGSHTTNAALQCATEIARHDPSAVLDLAPKVAELLVSDNPTIRLHASYILAQIARDYPDEVKPVTPKLAEQISANDETFQTNVLAALGHLSPVYTSVGRSALDSIAQLTEASSARVRGNVVGLMADFARQHPDAVSQYQPLLVNRLEDPDETVRANAVSAILHIGLEKPDDADDALPGLIELIDDLSPMVRRNVARTLGHLEAAVAIEQVRSLSDSDPDEGVREIAAWAITRMTQ